MKTFYDIHMHAFDLSHPNLSLFLQRENLIDSLLKTKSMSGNNKQKPDLNVCKCNLYKIIVLILSLLVIFIVFALFIIASPFILLLLVLGGIIAYKKLVLPYGSFKNALKVTLKNAINFLLECSLVRKHIRRIMRTITFFEIPHEYQFLVMEHFLKKSLPNSQIMMGGEIFNKIVLCPLIIDFGYKNIPEGFYNLTPKHPIGKQTGDMFYAIRTYFRFEIVPNLEKNKFDLSSEIPNWHYERGKKLFEIYPFMGLNTQNYDLDELKKLLDKYFKNFSKEETAEERKMRLIEKMGMLNSNMYRDKQILTEDDKEKLRKENIAPDYQYAFAGIKVYPQLGFDPYPDDSKEFEKVKFLYEYCVAKRIPITTHCSDGGYKTGDNDKLTSPLTKWTKVLEHKEKEVTLFDKLTLNFAHFGSQKNGKTEWRKAIIELTKKYENVYTDISCNNMGSDYNRLENDFKNNVHLQDKVLFGSDFSINMLVTGTDSYNENLEAFVKTELTSKVNLCELNPERFLFGG